MMKKILIYGYGNPGRQDDGLGILLAEKIRDWAHKLNIAEIKVDTNYQLNIEDADTISDYDMVFFADASQEEIDSYEFTTINPSDARVEFTMHAVSPAYILHLCSHLFNKYPPAYLLHIKGYAWDFREGLTEKAEQNLRKASRFLKELLSSELKIETKFQTV